MTKDIAERGIAFDRASVRSYDADGRLHVEVTNISKANICPYLGREIPDWEALGLVAGKVYQLLRDPEELAKAAPTFNNIPVLSRHVPVSAADHQPGLVIGATGTDAEFVAPYLRNSLVIWAAEAIEDVESEVKKELSSAYRYRADMTPGEFEGARYDGVMRDIVGNHVALVREGRAGPDVVVGDSKEDIMKHKLTRKGALTQGALVAYLAPKLAQDAKIDLTAALAGVTGANFKAKKPAIIEAVKQSVAGKLAQDADIGDLVQLLDAVEGVDPVEATDGEEPATKPLDPNAPAPAQDDDGAQACIDMVGKLSPEDRAKVLAALNTPAGAADADEPPAPGEKDEKKDMVTKTAMDAAIATARDEVTRNLREVREAERAVRPYVGEIAIACDSAEQVYRHALSALGVKHESIHQSALKAILELQPVPGAKPALKVPSIAQDAKAAEGFASRIPGAARIGLV